MFLRLSVWSTTFGTGKDNIISEFKENLAKHSQTIPAIAVLEALANDEGKPGLIQTFS